MNGRKTPDPCLIFKEDNKRYSSRKDSGRRFANSPTFPTLDETSFRDYTLDQTDTVQKEVSKTPT